MGLGFRRDCAAALVVLFLSILCASPAAAREVYVANFGTGTVSVLDTATNQVVSTIPTGVTGGSHALAIAPDGRTVYAVNFLTHDVRAISTQTKSVVGDPMPVGPEASGIAISPNGQRAYVVDGGGVGEGAVTVLDLVGGEPVGGPIPVGNQPKDLVLSPDGSRLYVGDSIGLGVTVLDTATNRVVDSIAVDNTFGLAIAPDGRTLVTASQSGASASIVDLPSKQVSPPIPLGGEPSGVAISPDGSRAYVANQKGFVSVIELATRGVTTIPGFGIAEFVTLAPSGTQAYVSEFSREGVAPLALPANQRGPTIKTGAGAGQPAVVPNQPPVASFAAARVRPGVPATLDAAASRDPDGTVASFAWAFGDGGSATVPTPTVRHTFAKPGEYTLTLTLTDNEGCSTAFVFTGQTAYCNGQATAVVTKTIVVTLPGVRLRCPASAKPGGCKFKLRAVGVKGRGERKRVKAQSAIVRAKVKAGGSKIVSLKPAKRFRGRLARAKKILVALSRTIDGETSTTVRKLPVAR